jgi:hypothetical protein
MSYEKYMKYKNKYFKLKQYRYNLLKQKQVGGNNNNPYEELKSLYGKYLSNINIGGKSEPVKEPKIIKSEKKEVKKIKQPVEPLLKVVDEPEENEEENKSESLMSAGKSELDMSSIDPNKLKKLVSKLPNKIKNKVMKKLNM